MTIGGGTGSFVVLSSLKPYPVRLKAVISMADDGGSTGVLRDEYGVLPPGDIRMAVVALSDSSKVLRDLFNFRFSGGGLSGHSFGNLFLTALDKLTGSFQAGVREAGKILNIRGEVIPVTTDNVRLQAILSDGRRIRKESKIRFPARNRVRVRDVWLAPKARINPDAKRAIAEADLIVIGPGDLYRSVIPNLLVSGVPEAIRKSKAKKVYIANVMTNRHGTYNFSGEDYANEIERYLGKNVLDAAIFNTKKPPAAVLTRYRYQGSSFVRPPAASHGSMRFIKTNLIDGGTYVRHSAGTKLARLLLSLV